MQTLRGIGGLHGRLVPNLVVMVLKQDGVLVTLAGQQIAALKMKASKDSFVILEVAL